jgi:hypothetical protein
MSNYTKTTNFATKDSLPSGNPAKIVKGTEIDTEFNNISVAVATKPDTNSITGGTGIDTTPSGTSVSVAIDSTVATLTGTQTLTNKTLTTPVISGNLTTDGNIDGRDVAADGTKLDTVETNADVTDTANVTAAGALMDSEVTNLAQVKAFDSTDYATAAQGTTADAALPKAGGAMTGAITTNSTFDGRDVATDGTKLDGIEASADVTDTANVTAAGALMDSELTSIASVKALDQGVATTDSPTFAAATVTGEITANGGIALGDGDKAIFGAGDDLQIYHDGSNSYISDTSGTGDLYLRGSNLRLTDNDGTLFLFGATNADTRLYYAGTVKIATTSTGIDVTGTATMDGLTVQSTSASGTVASFKGSSLFGIELASSGVAPYIQTVGVGSGEELAITSGGNKVALFQDGGDISFYEDTGTTPKLFWDASAESLGIGTSSLDPNATVHAQRSDNTYFWAKSTAADSTSGYALVNDARTWIIRNEGGDADKFQIRDATANAQRLTIDSTGNVGIGTSSPASTLEIAKNDQTNGATLSITNSFDGGSWAAGDTVGTVDFRVDDVSTTQKVRGQIKVFDDAASGNNSYPFANAMSFSTGYLNTLNERMRIDSSGRVGIGTSSPSETLAVESISNNAILLNSPANRYNAVGFQSAGVDKWWMGRADTDIIAGDAFFIGADAGNATDAGGTNAKLVIDSTGNVLVGKTATGSTVDGFEARASGYTALSDTSGAALNVNRNTTDGNIVTFTKDGTTVGSIGTFATDITIGKTGAGLRFEDSTQTIRPHNISTNTGNDANVTLGSSDTRFKDIYRSGSTYSTSDRNMKQDIRELTDAERNVAVACKGLLKAFRFIDAVEKDGDDANIHFGVIAQELAEAFEAEGLDANDYQVYKSATITDEDDNEQTRLNVCYENLLAFIIAAL